jgi:hypothetical protein
MEETMSQEEIIKRVREAIKDRATWFALLYRSFAKVLPQKEVERACREAIYEFGKLKGKKDAKKITPEEWVEKHMSKGSGEVFESQIYREKDHSEQRMTFCPLVEAWKELGCSKEEVDLFCDIAMEGDRGRADYHGIPYEIPKRLGKGDSYCRLLLKKCG